MAPAEMPASEPASLTKGTGPARPRSQTTVRSTRRSRQRPLSCRPAPRSVRVAEEDPADDRHHRRTVRAEPGDADECPLEVDDALAVPDRRRQTQRASEMGAVLAPGGVWGNCDTGRRHEQPE